MRVDEISKAKAPRGWIPVRRPFTNPCKMQEQVDQLPPGVALGVLSILCGVEVECEDVGHGIHADLDRYWEAKLDDSLRGASMEFLTKMGARVGDCGEALTGLMALAKQQKWSISDRTSIHIHLNVLNMTMDQLNGLIILYTVCEQSLFNYASAHRAHNIFCVPFESHLFGHNYQNLEQLLHDQHKYSSLNMKAVYTHGTVEFRHMETVYEVAPVWTWMMLLGLLHRYATITPLGTIKEQVGKLKIMSEYDLFLRRIFFGYSQYLRFDPIDLDSAVSDSKLLFF